MDAQSHCNSCVYFDDHAANDRPAPPDAGLCRFNPPVSQPGPDAHGLWPVVKAEDWCGHHMSPHHGRGMSMAAQ